MIGLPAEIKVKTSWKAILVSSGIIVAAMTGIIFAYNTWYNIPVLTFEVLPAYPVSPSEQIVAVIVRNEGRASATDVRIFIQANGEISVLPTVIQEETKIASQNATAIVATLPRLPPGAQISLYLKIQTSANPPVSNVYVSSLQGLGSTRSQVASRGLMYYVTMIRDILAIFGVFIIVILVGSGISSRRKKEAKQAKT